MSELYYQLKRTRQATLASVLRIIYDDAEQFRLPPYTTETYDIWRDTRIEWESIQNELVAQDILPSSEDSYKWTYPVDPNDYDSRQNFVTRTKTTLQRIIQRRIKVERKLLKDHQLNLICSYMNAEIWGERLIEDVEEGSGEFVQKAYNEIAGSCMHGHAMTLYVSNPEIVSIVRYKNKARALVWTIDGQKYLDRIYPNDTGNRDHQIIRQYAESKGYNIRTHHGPPDGGWDKDLTVYLPRGAVDGELPYADSFHYVLDFNEWKGSIELSTSSDNSIGELNDTDGGWSESTRYCCYECGDRMSEDEGYNTPNGDCLCESCYDRMCFSCSDCYDTTWNSDGIYLEAEARTICSHCYSNNYVTCEDCDCVVDTEATHLVNRTPTREACVCSSCYEDHYFCCDECGEQYHLDEENEMGCRRMCDACAEGYSVCDECETVTGNDATVIHNGQLLCESCHSNMEVTTNA